MSNLIYLENLRRSVLDCPLVLHFSGHGAENNKATLGQDHFMYKDKGDMLLLEDENGMTSYYFEDDLRTHVEVSKNKFELVFVSSCHSEFAGRVFLNAGAKHVICIKQSEVILDSASLKFSSVFYETLFNKGYSVCEAFKVAKQEIQMIYNATEASKFKLFIQGQDDPNFEKRHKCSAIMNLREGQLTNIDEEPMFEYLPDKVEMFLGREVDMFQIIKLLHKGRVVSILGPPGIGKSSISRNLGHYFKFRRQFKDGVIYVKLRGCKSSQMFITHLSLSIRSALGESELDNLEEIEDVEDFKEDILIMKKQKSTINDKKEVKEATLDILKTKQVLIVLDN